MRWLRRLLRRHMKPIDEYDAIKWRLRLSFLYAFFAWNALGYVGYQVYHNKLDWAAYYGLKLDEEINKRPAIYWAETLNTKKARIMRVRGLTVLEDFQYVAPEVNYDDDDDDDE